MNGLELGTVYWPLALTVNPARGVVSGLMRRILPHGTVLSWPLPMVLLWPSLVLVTLPLKSFPPPPSPSVTYRLPSGPNRSAPPWWLFSGWFNRSRTRDVVLATLGFAELIVHSRIVVWLFGLVAVVGNSSGDP